MTKRSLLFLSLLVSWAGLEPGLAQESAVSTVANAAAVTPPDSSTDEIAQSPWTFKGNASVTLSQVSLVNWIAGGENSYALNSGVDLTAAYKNEKNTWDNNLKMGYGFIKQQTETKRLNNADRINFSTKYGRHANSKWYYSALFDFKTQFDQGFKSAKDSVKISDFMSPAYITLSLGMDFKHENKFTMLMSPLAGKMTIVRSAFLNSQRAFGVDSGKVARLEMGGSVKLEYAASFWADRLNVKSTLEFFSNYLEKPQNVDLNWDLTTNLKISDYITLKFQVQAIYDDDSRIPIKDEQGNVIKSVAKLQVKEFVGFGLAYMFDTSKRNG